MRDSQRETRTKHPSDHFRVIVSLASLLSLSSFLGRFLPCSYGVPPQCFDEYQCIYHRKDQPYTTPLQPYWCVKTITIAFQTPLV